MDGGTSPSRAVSNQGPGIFRRRISAQAYVEAGGLSWALGVPIAGCFTGRAHHSVVVLERWGGGLRHNRGLGLEPHRRRMSSQFFCTIYKCPFPLMIFSHLAGSVAFPFGVSENS